MSQRERIETAILSVVFIFYILFLLKLLLFSRVLFSDLFSIQRAQDRSINLIPFNSIKGYIFSGSGTMQNFSFANVIGNIVVFIPLGTYLALFKKNRNVLINLLVIFIMSFFVEIVQGILAIGSADIDDIILNCLGGLIGILGYRFLLLIFRDHKKVHTAITALSVAGLPVLFYYLFMIKLRL